MAKTEMIYMQKLINLLNEYVYWIREIQTIFSCLEKKNETSQKTAPTQFKTEFLVAEKKNWTKTKAFRVIWKSNGQTKKWKKIALKWTKKQRETLRWTEEKKKQSKNTELSLNTWLNG